MHSHHIRNGFYLVGAAILIGAVATSQHIPGAPPHGSVPAVSSSSDGDCHTRVLATDGVPPPGAPRLDPQKLCGALDQAEKDAACVGDWDPPTPISAREFCIELHQRGCGDPTQNCATIPADQTYYTHH